MILHCNFEELRALMSAGELIVGEAQGHPGAVAAPPEGLVMIELLLPRLTGDVSIETLDDQRRVRKAVEYICSELHRRLDERIIETNPANEEAVAMYFDYGHARTVLDRLEHMGAEMEAIVELISGANPAGSSTVTFPD